jgi:small conductance mechanosensitive channel
MTYLLPLLTNTVIAIAILIAAWLGGNWIKNTIMKIKRLDSTLRSFLGGLAKYAIFVVACIMVLNQFGVQTASLIAVLGAAGLAIGLALQGTLSNVAAGVMMLIIRPFNVGDFIEFGNVKGTVKDLSLFGTELATLDNVYVYSPNSNIWKADVFNHTRNLHRRQDMTFGISYGDDINKAFKTIKKIVDKDERIITTEGKEPLIAVQNLGGSSVDILLRIWSKTSDFYAVQLELRKAIKEALEKKGLTIPFQTHTIELVDPNKEDKTVSKSKKAA